MASNVYTQPITHLFEENLFAVIRDQIKERQRQQQVRDAAFEAYFHAWKGQGLPDDAVIAEVLKNIYGDHRDCHTFDHALLAWFYSDRDGEAGHVLYRLLEKHLKKVVRKEWELSFKTV
ncbi:MAG: hypothetical protein KDI50_07580 [Candidatus Competibacteraceae bacterium]|nr:hypothetical protein [Candidatus Competibacteraceae bacterium]